MTSARFRQCIFRTTDVAAARAFYRDVLGHEGDGIVELPAAAIARGARPHWLEVLDVSGRGAIEEVAAGFIAAGATRLGPPARVEAGGSDVVVLRDPGGAMIALGGAGSPSRAEVGWHQLSTADAPRAARLYAEICGWSAGDEVDLGALGKIRPLGWAPGAEPRAGITGIEDRPELHPNWLSFFVVPSMERAIGEVLARGGKVVGPMTLPFSVSGKGDRFAACDDPQGAAFGIMERGS